MRHIRVNKLLRNSSELSLELLSELLETSVNPNDKLGILSDYESMTTNELIDMKNYLHRILEQRVDALQQDYISLHNRVNNPNLYELTENEEIILGSL